MKPHLSIHMLLCGWPCQCPSSNGVHFPVFMRQGGHNCTDKQNRMKVKGSSTVLIWPGSFFFLSLGNCYVQVFVRRSSTWTGSGGWDTIKGREGGGEKEHRDKVLDMWKESIILEVDPPASAASPDATWIKSESLSPRLIGAFLKFLNTSHVQNKMVVSH